ncbi:MAG: glycogen/starch synthase, partial [Actinomycetota bacterium]
MHIAFATAEIKPLVSAGGLGEAAAGLVAALRQSGHRVTVILPDYLGWELADGRPVALDVPDWAAPASAVRGEHPEVGDLVVVDGPGIRRPDPYVDADGRGWDDNDHRFASFAAAVASVVDRLDPDIVHLNDWHTALVPAFAGTARPTVLTIHNLAHQGWADAGWVHQLPFGRDVYRRHDGLNMLAGAIALADRVVTVSPGYAAEIVTPEAGMGLHHELSARGTDLVGIRNGIDTRAWDPAVDPHLPAAYRAEDLQGKEKARATLADRVGWRAEKVPT